MPGVRLKTATVAATIVATILCAPASADWIEDSDRNAMLVLRAQAAFQPESVARAGLSEYDGDIIDLGPDYRARRDESDRALLSELENRLADEAHPKVRQDLEILIQSIEDGLESRRIDSRHMLPYYNVHQLVFGSFNGLLDPRNDNARYARALDRLRKYTGTEAGYTAITELAKARSSERFDDGLLGPYRGEVDKDLSDAPRFVAGTRAFFEGAGLSGWEQELAKLEQQLADYADWVETEMLPRARPGNQLPAEVYTDNLKNFGCARDAR